LVMVIMFWVDGIVSRYAVLLTFCWNFLSDSNVTLFIRPDRIVVSTLKMEAACFCYNLPFHFLLWRQKNKEFLTERQHKRL